MDWSQIIWLSILQGLTEFLPVSSSGHLALAPSMLGWFDQGLAFDVAVHVGTLIAVLGYFHEDFRLLIREWVRSIITSRSTFQSNMAWCILFATVFIGLIGFLIEGIVSTLARNPISIAIATIGFGLLLGAADLWGRRVREFNEIRTRDMLLIGVVQILALIPGTSRSGVTLTAGMAMGLTRKAAARFSFLMAAPVIFIAGGWEGYQLITDSKPIDWPKLSVAIGLSASIAFLCIRYFLRYLERYSLMPFVWYRLILGVIILSLFL
ncbi:MAG: undecaprenyl-diphosphate phosphatase [Gammaproteobacteria bacterium]|nr:undecaprenyl-diphosphate phosphatase [Gammaproteobacteria bacterium]MCY4219177.1 undecaprenyl-diphosphate phosphatase [Gammaproteobacteria bacterium]MCY4273782.1 undecaprenyl-diphosphate phosphatase [Gammaproteobacteria bacterium]